MTALYVYIMAYIAPNSTIKLLKGVPIDNTYENTIYFDSPLSQSNYFSGLMKRTFEEQSYQRANRNSVRIEATADDLFDVNYIMFQNTSFGNKWFYAFVTEINYINNSVSEIIYELDVMQTWLFDYTLEPSFVVREHSATDRAGDNLVPENLETGEFVADAASGTGHTDKLKIVVAATFDKLYADKAGTVYGGIYSGLTYTQFEPTLDGAFWASQFIEDAATKADGIVSVFYAPADFYQEGNIAKTYNIIKEKGQSKIGTYTPKNKKLLTYPYTALYVTNQQGQSAVYRYEFFSDANCNFQLAGDFTPNTTLMLTPKNYKGVALNYDETLTLTGWAQCPWASDTYKAYQAQAASAFPLQLAGTALSVGMNAATGNALGAVSSVASTVFDIVKGEQQARLQPDHAHGQQSGCVLTALGALDFVFMNKHVTEEFARIIDDYFTMYGYATHRVKVPARNVRPHWTYCKTAGLNISGSIPSGDERKIVQIYDNGITWWKNGNEVGNYLLENGV